MNYSCLHTHTDFCDGEGDVESFCQAAWEKGLSAIGFSAHAPVTAWRTDWHMADDKLEEYMESVRSARRRWEGKLPVYLGLEADFIEGLMGPKDFQDLGLDYIIGSVHYVFPPNGGEPFTVDGPEEEFAAGLARFNGDGEALMETYWDCVDAMIREGGFDIIGHLDLIKKNNRRGNAANRSFAFNIEGERYRNRIRKIAALIGQSRVVVEVNTGGLIRGKTTDPYPSREILELLRSNDSGTPVIITADAHSPDHLGGHYDDARQTLLAAGYTRAVSFQGRQHGKAVWNEEPL
jgi:histidinol-phosphatase (PHP family)